jgi:tetratricopeptide (TPR) repeat protein
MKMSGLAIITLVLCASCQEQTENKTDQLGLKKRLYEAAVELEDLRTAAVALNELILMDSGTHRYKDSLARIYIKSGNYTGAISLAEGLIESELADNKLKELIGVAYQQQKDYFKARDIFIELFA